MTKIEYQCNIKLGEKCMEKENEKELMGLFKKNKTMKRLIIGFLLASIFCLCIGIIINSRALPEAVDVSEVTDENQYVECEVYALTDSYAEYTEDDVVKSEYYMAVNDKCLYILELSKSEYLELSEKVYDEDNTEPVIVYGMSDYLSTDLIEITIEAYNEMYEEDPIDDENFEDYFVGYVIDIGRSPNDSSITFYVLAGFLGFLVVIFGISQLVMYLRTKNHIKKYAKIYDLGELSVQLTDPTNVEYNKTKTIFTKNYLISYSDALVIFKYTDIVWIYPMDYRVNGVLTTRRICVVTKDNKKQIISDTPANGKENQEQFAKTMQEIYNRRPHILTGYTNENITAMNKENFANTIAQIEAKDNEER